MIMENNVLRYLDDPAKVAAELKEQHRPAAKIAKRELPNLAKAEAESREGFAAVNARYPQGVSCNIQLLYDAVKGAALNGCLAKVEDTLLRWDRLSAADVAHVLETWPTDINRVTVLDTDLAYGFGLANRARAIREDIEKLLSDLEHEQAEVERLGPGDSLWTIPPMTPVERDVPVKVVTGSKPLR
jgi:hypothetical protein